MQLSVREWERVAEAPVVVFVLVAFADRELTEQEQAEFREVWLPRLSEVNVGPNDDIMGLYRAGLEEATVSLRPYTRCSVPELLEQLSTTFEMMRSRVRASRVADFRDTLMLLASDVADASGGFSFLVDATSDEEATMIERVRAAIDAS